MRLDEVGRVLRLRPAVLPRTIGQIQAPNRSDGLARLPGDTLILSVPDYDAGVVPSLAHPFDIFGDDLFGLWILRRLVQQPNGKLILNQKAFLIGDFIPKLRRKAYAVANRVPVHGLELSVQLSHPFPFPSLF